MKNKDTILLENAYDQVVNRNVIKENEPNREPETRYLSASNGWDTLGDIIFDHLYDSGYEGDGVDQRDDSTVWVWDANPEKLKKLVEYLNANGYPVADYTLPSASDEQQVGIIDFYDDYPQHDEEDPEYQVQLA
jgi:hypothetical protein